MSENEKNALETILNAIPKMSEFQKGRLYGIAETMEEQNKDKTKKKGETETKKQLQEAGMESSKNSTGSWKEVKKSECSQSLHF